MATLLGGCAFETASTTPTSGRPEASKPAPTAKQPTALQKPVDPAQVERLKKAMPSQVKVGIIDDPEIKPWNQMLERGWGSGDRTRRKW